METTSVQPRTELEEELVALWSERLRGRPPGVTDHLMAIGGDSLTALRIIATAQRRYRVRIDRKRLFAAFTVATMAELITEVTGGSRR